jgi:hypothetical protein
MTDKSRQRIEVALLALLFGAGAGWGAFQWQLSSLAAQVQRIDQRVAAMYCSTVPEPQRAACR